MEFYERIRGRRFCRKSLVRQTQTGAEKPIAPRLSRLYRKVRNSHPS